MKAKALFLDRDGVINKFKGYITSYKDFKFLSGVKSAIKYANKKNYLIIIVTNQSGIGRSYMSEEDLNKIHSKMKNTLFKFNKAKVDDIFFSPYYKNSKIKKYRTNKNDRKPKNVMLLKAIKKWNISVKDSFFIGDKITDKQAAKKTGVKFYYKKKISLYKQVRLILK